MKDDRIIELPRNTDNIYPLKGRLKPKEGDYIKIEFCDQHIWLQVVKVEVDRLITRADNDEFITDLMQAFSDDGNVIIDYDEIEDIYFCLDGNYYCASNLCQFMGPVEK